RRRRVRLAHAPHVDDEGGLEVGRDACAVAMHMPHLRQIAFALAALEQRHVVAERHELPLSVRPHEPRPADERAAPDAPAPTVFSRRRVMKLVAFSSRSIAASEPMTTAGGRVFEKRYGRDLWRRYSTSTLGPVVKPPCEPPRALPRVEVCASILPRTPSSSCVPRPRAPSTPVACESSTTRNAPYS